MADGPDKDLAPNATSKQFYEGSINGFEDQDTLYARGGDACLSYLSDADWSLIAELNADGQSEQPSLDLSPNKEIEDIFTRHPRSPFSDDLQRERRARTTEGQPSQSASDGALRATGEKIVSNYQEFLQADADKAYDSQKN